MPSSGRFPRRSRRAFAGNPLRRDPFAARRNYRRQSRFTRPAHKMRRARKAGARRTGAFGACAAGRLEKALCKFTFYVLFSHLFTNSIDNFAKFVYNTNTIQYAASKATKGLQIKVKNALRTLLVLLLLLSLFLVSVSALPAVVSGSETAGTVDAVINAASTESAIRFSADRAVRLKSFSTGGYAYTMYTLLPYGYAILCDETGALMEACYEESALPPISHRTFEGLLLRRSAQLFYPRKRCFSRALYPTIPDRSGPLVFRGAGRAGALFSLRRSLCVGSGAASFRFVQCLHKLYDTTQLFQIPHQNTRK